MPERPTGEPPPDHADRLLAGTHPDPHAVLGCHPCGGGIAVRTLQPRADAVDVLFPCGDRVAMARVHPGGLFSVALPGPARPYRLAVRTGAVERVVDDGYRHPPTTGPPDLARFTAGRHDRLWTALGARRREGGVAFTVWAPRALGVRLTGDVNGWCGTTHPLRRLAGGVWEVWVPDVPDGSRYRFEVLGADRRWREKTDPMASSAKATASVVFGSTHRWADGAWLARRGGTDRRRAPISIYQVHLGSWSAGATDYRSIAGPLAAHVRRTGFTHVQFLPLAEHPFTGSWGYQVGSYYAPTARYGDPDGLRHLVDRLHGEGVGVLFDVVPAHFARDDWALAGFDGAPLYEYADPRIGEHPEWGTRVFDFGRPEVRSFLISAASYWVEEFHADGLRVDAVSAMLYRDHSRTAGNWLPNVHGGHENREAASLLRQLTDAVHARHPGVLLIAEESTAWPGVTAPDGLGFDLKWNLGWSRDTLDYFHADPAARRGVRHRLTQPLRYAWDERFVLPLSHDDVAVGRGSLWSRLPGDDRQRAAGMRALLAHTWAHPGKQLLFMGGEFGQPDEWDVNGTLSWQLVAGERGAPLHRGIHRLVTDLNARCRTLPALHSRDHDPAGFEPMADADIVVFTRVGVDGSRLTCVANFSDEERAGHRVGLPSPGPWWVVLDTDLVRYGGSRITRPAWVRAVPEPAHGLPCSVDLRLAPSSVLWLSDIPCSARECGDLP